MSYSINHMYYKCDLQREEKKRELMGSEISLQRIQIKYKVCTIRYYCFFFFFFYSCLVCATMAIYLQFCSGRTSPGGFMQ